MGTSLGSEPSQALPLVTPTLSCSAYSGWCACCRCDRLQIRSLLPSSLRSDCELRSGGASLLQCSSLGMGVRSPLCQKLVRADIRSAKSSFSHIQNGQHRASTHRLRRMQGSRIPNRDCSLWRLARAIAVATSLGRHDGSERPRVYRLCSVHCF